MSNSINPRPLENIFQMPIVDNEGRLTRFGRDLFRDLITRSDKVLTNKGEVQAQAPVTGRAEGLGTTVQNMTAAGDLATADHVAADGAIYARVKGGNLTAGNVDLANASVQGRVLDNIADGAVYGRVVNTGLTANKVDLSKAGVVGPMPSAKTATAVSKNQSNDGTCDSFDAGANATVRVYGPGGVGSNWSRYQNGVLFASYGPVTFTGKSYATRYYLGYDTVGNSWTISNAYKDVTGDGMVVFSVLTVSAGGGGGSSGGGGGGAGGSGGVGGDGGGYGVFL